MTASIRTPTGGNEGSGRVDDYRADGGIGDQSDERSDDRTAHPSPETYRRRALQGAAHDVADQSTYLRTHLLALETRLHDGDHPTPTDLLALQHVLLGSTEAILASLEELTVDDEPEFITDLRTLALETSGVLLHAASILGTDRQLHPGPYENGKRTLERAVARYALLEEYGGVRPHGESPREFDPDDLERPETADDTDSRDGVGDVE